MDELAIVAAFKRGNRDDAIRLLPPVQQQNLKTLSELTTEFKSLYPDCEPSKNVTILHLAAYHGWLDFIENFKDKSGFNCRDVSNGLVPLHYAAAGNSLSVIEYLINEQDCDPATTDNCGALPLHIACLNGQLDVVKYFITVRKCYPTSRGQHGWTPLHYASQQGHMNIIQYFINELGCDSTTTNNYGHLPLHIASLNGHFNTVKYYIREQKCDPNSQTNYGSTPLYCASENGHMDIIQYLITELGCDPTISNSSGSLPLHIASLNGHLNTVKYFISEQKCDPNSQTNYGSTPLYCASQNGHMDIVQYLITELGCDPTISDNYGKLPLHIACRNGHLNIAKCLINEFGCDPTAQSSKPLHNVCICIGGHLDNTKCNESDHGFTPLHYASQGGHVNIIQYLINELGCDPYTKTCNDGTLPLHMACLGGQLSATKYFIKEHKFNPNIQNHHGYTPLHVASQHGHMDVILYLITELGCNPNTRNIIGGLPLHLACLGGQLNVVKYFITERNCDSVKYCRNKNGFTPLHYASQGGRMNVIQYLITELGCDPTTPDNYGSLPLHIACLFGHLNATKYLITKQKHNPNRQKNNKGYTPLHCATERGHMTVIQCLISELGCDPATPDNHGSIPLHIACLYGHLNATKYLITEQKCNPNKQKNNKGYTPLHCAIEGGHMKIIQCLITELGCDPTIPDSDGCLPLHIASLNGHLNVVKYFIIELSFDSNCRNKNGSTPLHCATEGGHMNIIQYLVTNVKSCDSSVVDNEGKNILHLASYYGHPQIVEWLLHLGQFDIIATDKFGQTCIDLAGYKNKNRYEMLELFEPFIESSKEFPIHTFSKTVIVGNSSAGKTTLAKVITERARAYFWSKYGNVGEVQPNSAGIVMSQVQSKEAGKMVLYDLAGQAEYHSSHSAVMETVMHQSPATFIIVIDLSNENHKIVQQLRYWLNFTDSVTFKCKKESCLIVVGSHSDKEKKFQKKLIRIDNFMQRRAKSQDFLGIFTMDCRKINSKNTKTFISVLHKSHRSIVSRAPSMSYYCHLLYGFFKSKPEIAVFTLSNLIDLIPVSIKKLCPIQSEQQFFVELLTTLNNKGMIIFLKNENELDASWIVVDIEAVLEKINGVLFAPKEFLEHQDIASNTGIVRSSALHQLFPQYDIEMLTGFLQTLDLCHHVNLSGITTNLHSIGQSTDKKEHLLFFPCLFRYEPSFSISDGCFSFGWCLCCREPDYQFFTSRFLHVLLLRLADMSTASSDNDTKSSNYERACDVWNNGICWDNEEGITTVVELLDFNRRVVVLMSTSEETRPMEYIKYRSSVIRLILDLQHELCPNMQTTQYLICQAIFRNSPIEETYPPDNALFPMKHVARSMFTDKPYIFSCANKFHKLFSTKCVLEHEPYYQLRISSVCQLLDSKNADKTVSQSLLDEVKIICQAQELEQQTHSSLRKYIDKLSIFAGTNPIVSLK